MELSKFQKPPGLGLGIGSKKGKKLLCVSLVTVAGVTSALMSLISSIMKYFLVALKTVH